MQNVSKLLIGDRIYTIDNSERVISVRQIRPLRLCTNPGCHKMHRNKAYCSRLCSIQTLTKLRQKNHFCVKCGAAVRQNGIRCSDCSSQFNDKDKAEIIALYPVMTAREIATRLGRTEMVISTFISNNRMRLGIVRKNEFRPRIGQAPD